MPSQHRRNFLKTSVAAVTLGGADLLFGSGQGIGHLALAHSPEHAPQTLNNGPLIIVFQRGAADGLAMLSPLDDADFVAARPPDMRFARSESSGKLQVNGQNFYWHPEASPLAQLYQSKTLLAWQAVGMTNETRSHFEAQEMIERGVSSLSHLPDNLGWMARKLAQSGSKETDTSLVEMFAGNNSVPRAIEGGRKGLAIRDLQAGIQMPNGTDGMRALQALCAADTRQQAVAQTMQSHLQAMAWINQRLPKSTDDRVLPYETAGQTEYPISDPGVGLRSVARLLQAKVPLQYAWVDQMGWDTHESQPGRLKGLIKNLGQALQAFAQDMAANRQSYTLVVLTEFGRRLRSNRSNGTDHGHGSLSLVMGDRIPGGESLGRWPGLSTATLDRNVDLAVTTDYQQVLQQAALWNQQKTTR